MPHTGGTAVSLRRFVGDSYDLPMPGRTGALIAGRYRLVEPVGHSSTGQVWRARATNCSTGDVAVREIPLPAQPPQEHADLLAAAMGEARAAARLDHPGVVAIYNVVEHDHAPWIVMRFVAGQPLTTEIARLAACPGGEPPGSASRSRTHSRTRTPPASCTAT